MQCTVEPVITRPHAHRQRHERTAGEHQRVTDVAALVTAKEAASGGRRGPDHDGGPSDRAASLRTDASCHAGLLLDAGCPCVDVGTALAPTRQMTGQVTRL